MEKENKMEEVDLYVLDKIYEYIDKLRISVTKIALNIYPTSFLNPEIGEKIAALVQALRKKGIDLIVEITEQALVASREPLLKLVKEHDVIFAIDDFGSGYSNFLQLIEMADLGIVKMMKVDGSLVKSIDKDVKKFDVLKNTFSLGLQPIVLEYVENKAILQQLTSLSGDILYRGFYFDKALPIDTLVSKYKKKKEDQSK
jgi:EAL domain-containing protein (putative c-di-GMP-specific phosphodiesterase class I)